MSLIRLAYASEATFHSSSGEHGIEPNVARILMASRRNNARQGIVGGLFYGDGCFFQYLEGEEAAVRSLYERIAQDPRHARIRTLLEEPLQARSFSNWSMKYVPLASDIRGFLERHSLAGFNPYLFNRQQCEEMIELIREASSDQKLVNHDEPRRAEPKAEIVPAAIRGGLLAAAVGLFVAVAFGVSLL